VLFCLGILRNFVLVGDIGDKHDILCSSSGGRQLYCMYTFRHEIHDCHLGCNRRNTEHIGLSLSEIFEVARSETRRAKVGGQRVASPPARVWESCKLPQQGSGQSPGRQIVFLDFEHSGLAFRTAQPKLKIQAPKFWPPLASEPCYRREDHTMPL